MFFHSLTFLALAATSVTSSVSASVVVQYPPNDQLPLMARVNNPFSWSLSHNTFSSSSSTNDLTYSVSSMPNWLSFDASTLGLHGTPTSDDQMSPTITITAHDSTDSASSDVTLCVSQEASPTLNIPIQAQFYASNPSLSSVFQLSPNSAITTTNPALRVPAGWSFSIGFDYETFKASNNVNVFYDALLADGSPLPNWITFKPKAITFDGYSPLSNANGTDIITLALHGSDQEGYTAIIAMFDLVVASQELISSVLPTINVTASTPFSVSLNSQADFTGVMVGNDTIQPAQIQDLEVDTSAYSGWLSFDPKQRVLTGTPPDSLNKSSNPILPVILSTTFNQSIKTNVSIAVVPSFFSQPTLPSVVADQNGKVQFDLAQYFSNRTSEQRSDINLTVSFNTTGADQYLHLDSSSAQLTGTLPANFAPHIAATFTAYSHVTHSTSHTELPIVFPASTGQDSTPSSPSAGDIASKKHHAVVVSLAISLSLVGIIILFVLLSLMRRWLREKDTALGGEEGTKAWTTDEKKYYGIDGLPGGINPPATAAISRMASRQKFYGSIGRGLRHVSPKAFSSTVGSPQSLLTSPGVIRKGEFLGKIKHKVRQFSDQYTRSRGRPVISRPRPVQNSTTIQTTMTRELNKTSIDGLPFEEQSGLQFRPTNPFDAISSRSYVGSGATSFVSSPTTSTDGRSIPIRRRDFDYPRVPDRAHVSELASTQQMHRDSISSMESVETHAAEAVVMTARAESIRSARSNSAISTSRFQQASRIAVPESLLVGGPRPPPKLGPRVIPFTSAVPVPPPNSTPAQDQVSGGGKGKGRITSLHAETVIKSGDGGRNADDLKIGAFYVNELGGDDGTDTAVHTLGVDQKFQFRIPIDAAMPAQFLQARLAGGRRIPAFLKSDLSSAKRERGIVTFEGVPRRADAGKYEVEIYKMKSGECVCRLRVVVSS